VISQGPTWGRQRMVDGPWPYSTFRLGHRHAPRNWLAAVALPTEGRCVPQGTSAFLRIGDQARLANASNCDRLGSRVGLWREESGCQLILHKPRAC
jgi:hypothetical protein